MRRYLLLLVALCSLWVRAQQSDVTLNCDKETYDCLLKVSNSNLSNGNIHLFTTTHLDLGWSEHVYDAIIERDRHLVTPTLEKLEKEPLSKKDFEQSTTVLEFFHRQPEQKERLVKLVQEGRLSVGASYIQPYEEMYSGESLARQFYLGKLWMRKNLAGYESKIYYNVDVPGRTLQMPQILNKSGVKCMFITRMEKGVGDWYSPDGSAAMYYSSGHYVQFYQFLGSATFEEFAKRMARESQDWIVNGLNDVAVNKRGVMPAMLNYEFMWDQTPIQNIEPYTSTWNSITKISCPGEPTVSVSLPKFIISTSEGFVEALQKTSYNIPSIRGERPNVWIYIHGPSHERAISASRNGDVLLTALEKFSTVNAILNNNMALYPKEEIDEIWRDKIYPDHGWGGKSGEVTDNLFLECFTRSQNRSAVLLDKTLVSLASGVNSKEKKGTPIVIFNPLSWTRSGVTTTRIAFKKGELQDVSIYDINGEKLASQLSTPVYYDDGSLRTATLSFTAPNVPSIGYTTVYLKPANKSIAKQLVNNSVIENQYYRVELGKGGVKQIFDKEFNCDLLNTDKFMAGEVFTVESVGNGAGEFDAIQPISLNGFDKMSNHDAEWNVIEEGDHFTRYKLRNPIKNAVIELQLTVYNDIKKIDFDIALKNWDGVLYREYRMAMPMANKMNVSYEVPFGAVEVGTDEAQGPAGERYQTPNQDITIRGIENWISAYDRRIGVTLSSSVVAVDFRDPTDKNNPLPILQPILLASRNSCYGGGNSYLQFGDHNYHFSLSSHKAGKTEGNKFGRGENEVLHTYYNPNKAKTATLPESSSFFSVNDPNLIITTVKRAENSDDVVYRLYNISQNDTEHKLVSPILKNKGTKKRLNIIEDEVSNTDITRVGKYAIETFMIQ
ncbi:glycoside hydrolase family 38 N-terminal domain-containing protein [Bacteroides sp.]